MAGKALSKEADLLQKHAPHRTNVLPGVSDSSTLTVSDEPQPKIVVETPEEEVESAHSPSDIDEGGEASE